MILLREVPFGQGDIKTLAVDGRAENVEEAAQLLTDHGFVVEVCLVDDIVTMAVKNIEVGYQVSVKAAPNGPAFLEALDALILEYAEKLKSS